MKHQKRKCPRLSPRAFNQVSFVAKLERQLSAELNSTRIANAYDLCVSGGGRTTANPSEVSMIENVECFTANLQIHSIAEMKILE